MKFNKLKLCFHLLCFISYLSMRIAHLRLRQLCYFMIYKSIKYYERLLNVISTVLSYVIVNEDCELLREGKKYKLVFNTRRNGQLHSMYNRPAHICIYLTDDEFEYMSDLLLTNRNIVKSTYPLVVTYKNRCSVSQWHHNGALTLEHHVGDIDALYHKKIC